MAAADTQYHARFPYPEELEKGRDNLVKCEVYRSGSLVAPSSGTVSIYDASGTAIVDAQAVTVSGSVAQYNVTSATIDLAVEERWRIEWALTMPDGVVHTFRRACALVLRRLYCPITEADLYRRNRALDPSNTAQVITTQSDYTDEIDEGWCQVLAALRAKGRRPYLVVSPEELREVAILYTLAVIFDGLASQLSPEYSLTADRYREAIPAAWAGTSLVYDDDHDGIPEVDRVAVTGTVWLM